MWILGLKGLYNMCYSNYYYSTGSDVNFNQFFLRPQVILHSVFFLSFFFSGDHFIILLLGFQKTPF